MKPKILNNNTTDNTRTRAYTIVYCAVAECHTNPMHSCTCTADCSELN